MVKIFRLNNKQMDKLLNDIISGSNEFYKDYIESVIRRLIQCFNAYNSAANDDKILIIKKSIRLQQALLENEENYVNIVDKCLLAEYCNKVKLFIKDILSDIEKDIDEHVAKLTYSESTPDFDNMSKQELINYIKDKNI